MNRSELLDQIKRKKSYLCVGLDSDITKIPSYLKKYDDPIFEFNKRIIDATKDFCVAYKPNLAFYESLGSKGWQSLEKTLAYIPSDIFTIADAKRGDIGNTSSLYARAFFEYMNFDSVTVAPYMGRDSVEPFLQFKDRWVILLALTSNQGSEDFQMIRSEEQQYFYEHVIDKACTWGTKENLMFVVGATKGNAFAYIRKRIPDHFMLVPGVGAQGGNLEEVSMNGLNAECGLLVNSSRQIIYASSESDFPEKAAQEAQKLQQEMSLYLQRKKII